MAIERESTGIDLSNRQGPQPIQVRGPGLTGPLAPSVAQRDLTHLDTVDQALGGLLRTVGQVAESAVEREREEAYLRGASTAGRIDSEEMLDESPLTRDWAVAGFRNANARLKMAQSEAQLAKDMKQLREASPEEMEGYLNRRRGALMDSISGLGYEDRKAAVAKILTNDAAAAKLHVSEHAKWVVDTKKQARAADTAVQMEGLTNLRNTGNFVAYEARMAAVATTAAADIWGASDLGDDDKQEMTVELLTAALETDNVLLYETMTQFEGGGLTQQLTQDQQNKLGSKYREARQRAASQRNAQWVDQMAIHEAAMTNGTFDLTHGEFMQFLDGGTRAGAISSEKRGSLYERFLTYKSKAGNSAALAAAALSGDTQTIFTMGKTVKDAFDAFEEGAAKAKAPLTQVVGRLMQAGTNGLSEGFSRAGKWAAPSFNQLARPDGTLDPQHVEMVRGVMTALQTAEKNGLQNSFADFIQGLPESTQARVMGIRERMNTMSPDAAIAETLRMEAATAKLTPQQKAATAGATAAEDRQFVQGLEPRGFFGSIWTGAKAMFNIGTSRAEMAVRPYTWDFEDGDVIERATMYAKLAVSEELSALAVAQPHLSAESRQKMAMANVAARTIPTDGHGPVILPRGANVPQLLGVPPNTGNEVLGMALTDVLDAARNAVPEAKQTSFVFAQGRLMAKYYNEDGGEIRSDLIDPKAVGEALRSRYAKDRERLDEEMGAGVVYGRGGRITTPAATRNPRMSSGKIGETKPATTEPTVQFNGENAAGVEPALMLAFRKNLVGSEGVRDTPYKDTKGIETVGVGVAKHNPHYPKVGADGKISADDLRTSFLNASNDAAIAAQAAVDATGLYSAPWFLLFGEISYQSGTSSLKTFKSYRSLIEAGIAGDKSSALAALRNSPAWKASGAARRKSYEALLTQAME